jgi:large subunit ribosomal protein L25
MKTVPLKAEYRSGIGKTAVKKIRAAKNVPAVVYGKGINTTAIHVSLDDFVTTIHTKAGTNVVIDLNVDGAKKFRETVVIKSIQHNPLTEGVDHIDFNVVSLTEKIKVKVPLHVTGDAVGIKEGGILDVVQHEIEVECLPTEIPDRFDIDVTELNVNDAKHIRDLKFPSGVVSTLGEEEVIAAVHPPKLEEEPSPEEAPTEPELIGKKKEEGEGEVEGEVPAGEKKKEEAKPKAEGEKKE